MLNQPNNKIYQTGTTVAGNSVKISLDSIANSGFTGAAYVFDETFNRQKNPDTDIEILILERPGVRDWLSSKLMTTDFKVASSKEVDDVVAAISGLSIPAGTIYGIPKPCPNELGTIKVGNTKIATYKFIDLLNVEIDFTNSDVVINSVTNGAAHVVKNALCAIAKRPGPVRKYFDDNVISGYEVKMFFKGRAL